MLVVLKKGFIQGIITDGDLRRELKSYSYNQEIEVNVKKSISC